MTTFDRLVMKNLTPCSPDELWEEAAAVYPEFDEKERLGMLREELRERMRRQVRAGQREHFEEDLKTLDKIIEGTVKAKGWR